MANAGALRRAGIACLALAAACSQAPAVGEKTTTTTAPATATGPKLALASATVDATDHVTVTLTLEQDGAPATLAQATALAPSFTLAVLTTDPVSQLPAWKSHLLLGRQTSPSNPIAGPGTPAGADTVLVGQLQPGAETPDATDPLVEVAAGKFTFTFRTALPSPRDRTEPLRVGAFLDVAKATLDTATVYDFREGDGPVVVRQTVTDANCNGCHGTLRTHDGRRTGVKLCQTCHTFQNADPDTMDPAAMPYSYVDGTGATVTVTPTIATNPNPLELGRLVHRIHRGKYTPTMYRSSSCPPIPTTGVDVTSCPAAPALGAGNTLPVPFNTARTGITSSTRPILGRRFSFIGDLGRERVVAKVINRYDNDQPARLLADGLVFPRDLRDCAACHAGAPDAGVIDLEVSKRSCQSCHPDVWFGQPDGAGGWVDLGTDTAHFSHTGGPQADETLCAECHVQNTGKDPVKAPKLYAPIAQIHVAPVKHPAYDRPFAELVRASNFLPGQKPVVVFKLYDRNGPIEPIASPTWSDTLPDAPATGPASPLPRGMLRVAFVVGGPTSPDYLAQFGDPADPATRTSVPVPLQETMVSVTSNPPVFPDPTRLSFNSVSGEFTYTFSQALPLSATGTWTVGMEGRRTPSTESNATTHQRASANTTLYDKANDVFLWPYTGESLSENFDNPLLSVDTTAGDSTVTVPAMVPRRQVVDRDAGCNACHMRFGFHGDLRHRPEYCVLCHTPNRTDWSSRGKDASGNVALTKTWDGAEEASLHLKVLVHRIHTGKHQGTASQAIRPYIIGGSSPYFYDDGEFPNDLGNCRLCHAGDAFTLDHLPAKLEPTTANETAAVLHQGGIAHGPAEVATPPITMACLSCHGTAFAYDHAAKYLAADGTEQCAQCHVKGTYSVKTAHGIPETTTPP